MTYFILDYELLTHGELKGKLFRLYLFIYKYASRDGYCRAGNKRLSEDLDISEKTVKAYISRLEKSGLIYCKREDMIRKIFPLIEKKGTWSVILNTDILRDRGFSDNELKVYALICMWAKFGCCNRANSYIERALNMSDKSVKKYLSLLEKKGFLIRYGKTLNRKIIPLKYLCRSEDFAKKPLCGSEECDL